MQDNPLMPDGPRTGYEHTDLDGIIVTGAEDVGMPDDGDPEALAHRHHPCPQPLDNALI
jgi:hypothetical protein